MLATWTVFHVVCNIDATPSASLENAGLFLFSGETNPQKVYRLSTRRVGSNCSPKGMLQQERQQTSTNHVCHVHLCARPFVSLLLEIHQLHSLDKAS